MKPINFKEANVIFGKNQPEYKPLMAYRNDDECGQAISCWELTIKERIKLLFSGKIFVSLLTFGKAIQPQKLTLTFNEAKND